LSYLSIVCQHGFIPEGTTPLQSSFFATLKTKTGGGGGSRTRVQRFGCKKFYIFRTS